MACISSYKIRGKLRGLQDTWLSNILTRLACIFLEHSNTCTEWLRWHFPLNFYRSLFDFLRIHSVVLNGGGIPEFRNSGIPSIPEIKFRNSRFLKF